MSTSLARSRLSCSSCTTATAFSMEGAFVGFVILRLVDAVTHQPAWDTGLTRELWARIACTQRQQAPAQGRSSVRASVSWRRVCGGARCACGCRSHRLRRLGAIKWPAHAHQAIQPGALARAAQEAWLATLARMACSKRSTHNTCMSSCCQQVWQGGVQRTACRVWGAPARHMRCMRLAPYTAPRASPCPVLTNTPAQPLPKPCVTVCGAYHLYHPPVLKDLHAAMLLHWRYVS